MSEIIYGNIIYFDYDCFVTCEFRNVFAVLYETLRNDWTTTKQKIVWFFY